MSPRPSTSTELTPDSRGSANFRFPRQEQTGRVVRGSGDLPHVFISALKTGLQKSLPKVLTRPLRSAFGTTSQLTRDPATPALGGGNHDSKAEIRLDDEVNTFAALKHPMHVELTSALRQQMQRSRSRCTDMQQGSGVPFPRVTRVSRKEAVQHIQVSIRSPVPPGRMSRACGQAAGSSEPAGRNPVRGTREGVGLRQRQAAGDSPRLCNTLGAFCAARETDLNYSVLPCKWSLLVQD